MSINETITVIDYNNPQDGDHVHTWAFGGEDDAARGVERAEQTGKGIITIVEMAEIAVAEDSMYRRPVER